jgi:leucine dehydrogenase
MGIKASVKHLTGSDKLAGKKVMVQGVGSVGAHLVEHLAGEGAEIYVADIYEDRIKAITSRFKVNVVELDHVYETPMDIYSPCALGATVNDESLSKLKCSIICGAANNQLANESHHGEEVLKKGILYAPDYLVNAGGIINCYWEIIGYNRQAALKQAENIYNTTLDIYKKSADEKIPTYLAANILAEARIAALGKVKLSY